MLLARLSVFSRSFLLAIEPGVDNHPEGFERNFLMGSDPEGSDRTFLAGGPQP